MTFFGDMTIIKGLIQHMVLPLRLGESPIPLPNKSVQVSEDHMPDDETEPTIPIY